MYRIKNLFHRYKRTILASLGCVALIAMIAIVAVNSGGNVKTNLKINESVETSAPTAITFVMPIENGTITKDYSNRTLKYNSTLKQWEAHKGVDIKGADDAKVKSAYKGEVVSIENNYLTGTIITIKHNDNLQTVYSSLSEDVLVSVGDKVTTGQVIGSVSTSAKNESGEGPHLHFEVLENNIKVDPNLYLESANK